MWRAINLRQATVALVVAPVLLTAAVMMTGGYRLLREAETKVQETIFANLIQAIGAQADQHFLTPLRLLEEFSHRAAIGRMPLDDHDAMAAYLAERLRVINDVAWISWGEERNGRFVGARRREDGAIIINRSDPSIHGGIPEERLVHLDGSLEPIETAHPPYDPRVRPWYRAAAERTNLIWTSATQFHEGREGVTVAKAVHDPEGRLIGVFTVDFFTEQIGAFLDTLRAGQSGICFVKHKDGALILPTGLSPDTRRAFLQEHEQAIRQWRAARSDAADRPAARVRFAGDNYLLAFKESHVANGSGWHCGVLMPEREFTAPVARATHMLLALAASIAILAAAAGAAIASRLARSLHDLTDDLHEIGAGRLRAKPISASDRLREVQVLRGAIEQMKEALRDNAHLLTAVDQAERASKIKSDVLAMVAHDLRSPLQVIKGHGNLLRTNAADADESWLAIERACDIMEQLVQNMLELSRLEAGRLPVARIPFPVAEVVRRSHGAVSLAARAKALAIRMELGDPNLTMRSDPKRIEQILTNLLSNAVKYTTNGWIELVCRRTNGDVEFNVADTGPGMTPEELEIAFEPFKPGSAGRGRADSHGLGLAICLKLTERLGGTLKVESEPGRGTRFSVRLPIELPDTGTNAGVN